MFLKSRERVKKFYELVDKANEEIKNEKYDDAIGLYSLINQAYESIPKNMQSEEIAQKLDKLNRELILYLKIKEVHNLIANKNFSKVDDIINYMRLIINKLKEQQPMPISLIKFGEEKCRYYENLNRIESEKELFNKKYEKIREIIRKGDKKRAMLLFEDLKLRFKDIEKYGKALDLFEKLEQIKQKLEKEEIKHQINYYYENKAEDIKEKPIKKEPVKEEVKEKDVDEELSQIAKLLKSNDVNNAKRLFKKL